MKNQTVVGIPEHITSLRNTLAANLVIIDANLSHLTTMRTDLAGRLKGLGLAYKALTGQAIPKPTKASGTVAIAITEVQQAVAAAGGKGTGKGWTPERKAEVADKVKATQARIRAGLTPWTDEASKKLYEQRHDRNMRRNAKTKEAKAAEKAAALLTLVPAPAQVEAPLPADVRSPDLLPEVEVAPTTKKGVKSAVPAKAAAKVAKKVANGKK